MRTLVALMLCAAFCGCATSDPTGDLADAYRAYINQDRTYAAVALTGVDSLTLSGENIEMLLEAPLNPLSIRPQDPSTAQTAIQAVESVARVGIGVAGAVAGINDLSKRPVVVEQPAPVIVEPTFVER